MSNQGNVYLAAFYEMARNGFTPGHTAEGLIASTVAYGYTMAQTTCNSSYLGEQVLSVDCLEDGTGERVRANPNCQSCLQRVAQLVQDRDQLEQEAHAKNPKYVPQRWSTESLQALRGPASATPYVAGACQYVCNQCVVENITQNFQMSVTSSCDVTDPSFVAAFVEGVGLKAKETLSKYGPAMTVTTGGPSGGQSTEEYQNVANQSITNTLTQFFNSSRLTELHTQVLAVQSIRVEPGSTSLVLGTVDQSVSVETVAKLVEAIIGNQDDAFYQENIQSQQEILQKNTQINDLFKELTDTLSTLQDLLRSTLGQIMASMLAMLVLGVLMLGVAVYFRHSWFSVLGQNTVDSSVEQRALKVQEQAGSGVVAAVERATEGT